MGVNSQGLKLLNVDMDSPEFVDLEHFNLVLYSSKGKRAKNKKNEDSCGFLSASPSQLAMVVSDGLGGHKFGDRASRVAVNTVLGRSTSRRRPFKSAHMVSKIEKAQQKIIDIGHDAGATLVAAVIEGEKLSLYSVGDSLGFLINSKGKISYKTFEHSVTGFATESGLMENEEAQNHEQSNVILNALGFVDSRLEMSFKQDLQPGDGVFLCTDGLTDLLTVEEVAVQLVGPMNESINTLIDRCRTLRQEKDYFDDLTLIFCRRKEAPSSSS